MHPLTLSKTLLATFLLTSCTPTNPSPTDISYIPLERLASLPKSLSETSGLAHARDSSFFVHNDSGHKPRLYEIHATSGEILREVKVTNVSNYDWEELAEDSLHLYIGDFGNNEGIRKNLMIYIVSREAVLTKTEVEGEVILFTYPDPNKFATRNTHNADCEAMIVIGDSLYLFSKNRADHATNVYRLPNKPGEYVAEKIGHFNTQGLITAADFLPGETNTLALLGYEIIGNTYKSFIWICRDFTGTDFFGGTQIRYEVAPNLQAEAVLFDSDSTAIITNEEERGGRGSMGRVGFGK